MNRRKRLISDGLRFCSAEIYQILLAINFRKIYLFKTDTLSQLQSFGFNKIMINIYNSKYFTLHLTPSKWDCQIFIQIINFGQENA